jgi:hypothetical protein
VADYLFQNVYQKTPEDIRQEIIKLWLEAQVLSAEEARRRASEVVLTVRSDTGELIGVTTAYIRDFVRPANFYYYMRMFVKPTERKSFGMLKKAYRTTYTSLKQHQRSDSREVHGLVLEMENLKFGGPGAAKELATLGPVYWGKNAIGQDVWYHRFDTDIVDSGELVSSALLP